MYTIKKQTFLRACFFHIHIWLTKYWQYTKKLGKINFKNMCAWQIKDRLKAHSFFSRIFFYLFISLIFRKFFLCFKMRWVNKSCRNHIRSIRSWWIWINQFLCNFWENVWRGALETTGKNTLWMLLRDSNMKTEMFYCN